MFLASHAEKADSRFLGMMTRCRVAGLPATVFSLERGAGRPHLAGRLLALTPEVTPEVTTEDNH